MHFPDEEAQYKFKKFGILQFIYFSLLNFKDLLKHIVNRFSVSFRIDGISVDVFAIFRLLKNPKFFVGFRGRDCERSHIALNLGWNLKPFMYVF